MSLEESYSLNEDTDINMYLWDSVYHASEKMNSRIANELYGKLFCNIAKKLTKRDCAKTYWNYDSNIHMEEFYLQHDSRISEWYKSVAKHVKPGRNGAIVMNANPFTMGHRYLIENAAKDVDTLYVFAVEEDKSVFGFEDRYRMIKDGCEDIRNVVVLKSGQIMISAATLPGYFRKDSIQENYIYDAADDLELFCECIAPLFHIKARYVGEEPNDFYTNRYNEQMKLVLNSYGIEVHEIKRLMIGGEVVSGTKCRSLYEEHDIDSLRKYVPESTIRVLYSGIISRLKR